MERISKNPKERKSELIEAAEELFNSKGFEQTTIKDIVTKVGVAQGLFYYYFKTKDDVLNEIILKYIKMLLELVGEIKNDRMVDSKQKMAKIIELFFNLTFKAENIAEYIHHQGNGFHMRFEMELNKKLVPLIREVVEQGVKEQQFDTKYPLEAASVLLASINVLHKSFDFSTADSQELSKIKKAALDIIERILGAETNSFNLVI